MDLDLQKSRTILLIEDDENDLFFFNRALRSVAPHSRLIFASSGQKATEYLLGTGEFADRSQFPLPEIIYLDLKMPAMNGFEFLDWVRKHEEYRVIPIIVCSSSSMETDIRQAYKLGAKSYIVKPGSLTEFQETLRTILYYWTICKVPQF